MKPLIFLPLFLVVTISYQISFAQELDIPNQAKELPETATIVPTTNPILQQIQSGETNLSKIWSFYEENIDHYSSEAYFQNLKKAALGLYVHLEAFPSAPLEIQINILDALTELDYVVNLPKISELLSSGESLLQMDQKKDYAAAFLSINEKYLETASQDFLSATYGNEKYLDAVAILNKIVE